MNTDFKSIEKKVTAEGWILIRISGSHFQFKKEGVPQLLVIPNHGKRTISIGVVRQLEKITGLSLLRRSCYFCIKYLAKRATFLRTTSASQSN